MTVETFLALLTAFSILTSLCTEAIKMLLDSLKIKYASNLVVLVSSVAVGGIGAISFYLLNGYEWTTSNSFCILIMILANWLVAMLGYDKVMQAIAQMKGGYDNGKDSKKSN